MSTTTYFINIKIKSLEIIPNSIMSASTEFVFVRDSRMSSKKAVENEPSVFEPLKFYCMCAPVIVKTTLLYEYAHTSTKNLHFRARSLSVCATALYKGEGY